MKSSDGSVSPWLRIYHGELALGKQIKY
jgi:hypothetical protein